MHIAWFRPDSGPRGDDLSAVVKELARSHQITLVPQAAAHDFVWRAAHGVFDLCVHELDDSPAHQYIWPYLLHYPGVLVLRTVSLHDGRARALVHQHRDADQDAEMAFADGPGRSDAPWPLLRGSWSTWRVPVLASRVTVVADDALAALIARECPGAHVELIPAAVPTPPADAARGARVDADTMRVLVFDDGSPGTVERAAERARQAGARLEIVRVPAPDAPAVLDADVVVATRWPSLGRPLVGALTGAAAGRPVVVAECEGTANWPTLDPQTWQTRAIPTGVAPPAAPVAISVDPRDEEHSLMRAFVRLAADPALRASLGAAAKAWWDAHATVAHATAAWQRVIVEAAARPAPERPAGWPAHLDAAGERTTRAILDQFGIDTEGLLGRV